MKQTRNKFPIDWSYHHLLCFKVSAIHLPARVRREKQEKNQPNFSCFLSLPTFFVGFNSIPFNSFQFNLLLWGMFSRSFIVNFIFSFKSDHSSVVIWLKIFMPTMCLRKCFTGTYKNMIFFHCLHCYMV